MVASEHCAPKRLSFALDLRVLEFFDSTPQDHISQIYKIPHGMQINSELESLFQYYERFSTFRTTCHDLRISIDLEHLGYGYDIW